MWGLWWAESETGFSFSWYQLMWETSVGNTSYWRWRSRRYGRWRRRACGRQRGLNSLKSLFVSIENLWNGSSNHIGTNRQSYLTVAPLIAPPPHLPQPYSSLLTFPFFHSSRGRDNPLLKGSASSSINDHSYHLKRLPWIYKSLY